MRLLPYFVHNFLGHTAYWYKITILAFLVINPLVYLTLGPVDGGLTVGWMLMAQFIFTLAMALKCYPLLPGGLLALEAVFMGLTNAHAVYGEVKHGFEVILLLIFMVAGIYFVKDLLLFIFTRVLLGVRSKIVLSLLFSGIGAVLSAFLDALTVTAVVISVLVGFYSVYHKAASTSQSDLSNDGNISEERKKCLEQFRIFLCNLMMHAVVGTALGGVCTIVGEPQNLLIGHVANWNFTEFMLRMAPVTVPVFFSGLITCVLLEITGWFGYGTALPDNVRSVLEAYDLEQRTRMTQSQKAALIVQALVCCWLVIALMLHLASVGLIGLSVIVLATAFCGINEEHRIGHAFTEALPFTALLVVFFVIVSVINEQQLFGGVIHYVLSLDKEYQGAAFYLANGFLSAISDNVFVATVYIQEAKEALLKGLITRDTFDTMAVAINTGTNIPSVATPNGQAAFLLLLTSALAPLIRLSYLRMVWMALPYTIVMSTVGLLAVMYLLDPMTDLLYSNGWINHHSVNELLNSHE